jgi:hypothetical protein
VSGTFSESWHRVAQARLALLPTVAVHNVVEHVVMTQGRGQQVVLVIAISFQRLAP